MLNTPLNWSSAFSSFQVCCFVTMVTGFLFRNIMQNTDQNLTNAYEQESKLCFKFW